MAVVAVLAAILFPVFARAKSAALSSTCLQQTKQVGSAFALYLGDSDGVLPDRRDLKSSLPGGYRPWTSWPPSDPRAGWAKVVLEPYVKSGQVWSCPASAQTFRNVVQVEQDGANLWLWRFDRTDDPVPLDNFWGKSEDQAVNDLKRQGTRKRVIRRAWPTSNSRSTSTFQRPSGRSLKPSRGKVPTSAAGTGCSSTFTPGSNGMRDSIPKSRRLRRADRTGSDGPRRHRPSLEPASLS